MRSSVNMYTAYTIEVAYSMAYTYAVCARGSSYTHTYAHARIQSVRVRARAYEMACVCIITFYTSDLLRCRVELLLAAWPDLSVRVCVRVCCEANILVSCVRACERSGCECCMFCARRQLWKQSTQIIHSNHCRELLLLLPVL